MVDRNLLKQNIVENINSNGKQDITGSKLQKLLLEMVDSMLDPEGRYPDMSVGFSDNLAGRGESTPAEFTFRASGGKSIKDGAARIKRIKGNSVVVNGEVVHMNTESIKSVGDNAWDEEWENGILDVNGENYYLEGYIRSKNYIPIIGGEQYYYSNKEGKMEDYLALRFYDENKVLVDSFTQAIGTFTAPISARYMRFYPNGTYGDTYKNDIMLTLVHSGWKVDTDAGYQPYWENVLVLDKRIREAFPDGMKSAGQASDMAYNKNGKGYVQERISSIDLGTLEWGVDSGGFAYSQSTIPARVDALGVSRNVICAHFGIKQESYWIATTEDVLMIAENGKVFITGDILADTSASELKDKLDGVILYYESNAPTTYEYDQPFNLDYRVADFGTEEAISSQPSAAFRADIIYQFNAVDMIREHELEITQLQTMIATMQAQIVNLINAVTL